MEKLKMEGKSLLLHTPLHTGFYLLSKRGRGVFYFAAVPVLSDKASYIEKYRPHFFYLRFLRHFSNKVYQKNFFLH